MYCIHFSVMSMTKRKCSSKLSSGSGSGEGEEVMVEARRVTRLEQDVGRV